MEYEDQWNCGLGLTWLSFILTNFPNSQSHLTNHGQISLLFRPIVWIHVGPNHTQQSGKVLRTFTYSVSHPEHHFFLPASSQPQRQYTILLFSLAVLLVVRFPRLPPISIRSRLCSVSSRAVSSFTYLFGAIPLDLPVSHVCAVFHVPLIHS